MRAHDAAISTCCSVQARVSRSVMLITSDMVVGKTSVTRFRETSRGNCQVMDEANTRGPTQSPQGDCGTTRSSFSVPGVTRDIRVKIASERSEFEQAFGLLAANHRARGYEAPSDKP